jgi:tetratricopeptide (TPR) repeat protein
MTAAKPVEIVTTFDRYYRRGTDLPQRVLHAYDLNNNGQIEPQEKLDIDDNGNVTLEDYLGYIERNHAYFSRCVRAELVQAVDEALVFIESLKPNYRSDDTFSPALAVLVQGNSLVRARYEIEHANPEIGDSPGKVLRAVRIYYENLRAMLQDSAQLPFSQDACRFEEKVVEVGRGPGGFRARLAVAEELLANEPETLMDKARREAALADFLPVFLEEVKVTRSRILVRIQDARNNYRVEALLLIADDIDEVTNSYFSLVEKFKLYNADVYWRLKLEQAALLLTGAALRRELGENDQAIQDGNAALEVLFTVLQDAGSPAEVRASAHLLAAEYLLSIADDTAATQALFTDLSNKFSASVTCLLPAAGLNGKGLRMLSYERQYGGRWRSFRETPNQGFNWWAQSYGTGYFNSNQPADLTYLLLVAAYEHLSVVKNDGVPIDLKTRHKDDMAQCLYRQYCFASDLGMTFDRRAIFSEAKAQMWIGDAEGFEMAERVQYWMGQIYAEQGRNRKAAKYYTAALQMLEQNGPAAIAQFGRYEYDLRRRELYLLRAQVEAAAGKNGQAFTDFSTANSLFPQTSGEQLFLAEQEFAEKIDLGMEESLGRIGPWSEPGDADLSNVEAMAGNDFWGGTTRSWAVPPEESPPSQYSYDRQAAELYAPALHFGWDLKDVKFNPDWVIVPNHPVSIAGGQFLLRTGLSGSYDNYEVWEGTEGTTQRGEVEGRVGLVALTRPDLAIPELSVAGSFSGRNEAYPDPYHSSRSGFSLTPGFSASRWIKNDTRMLLYGDITFHWLTAAFFPAGEYTIPEAPLYLEQDKTIKRLGGKIVLPHMEGVDYEVGAYGYRGKFAEINAFAVDPEGANSICSGVCPSAYWETVALQPLYGFGGTVDVSGEFQEELLGRLGLTFNLEKREGFDPWVLAGGRFSLEFPANRMAGGGVEVSASINEPYTNWNHLILGIPFHLKFKFVEFPLNLDLAVPLEKNRGDKVYGEEVDDPFSAVWLSAQTGLKVNF